MVVAINVAMQTTRLGSRYARINICCLLFAEPEAPTNPQIAGGTVYIWQLPSKPNGVIIGYQLTVTYTNPSTNEETMGPTIELLPDIFVYDLRTLDIPDNVTAVIQVSTYLFISASVLFCTMGL